MRYITNSLALGAGTLVGSQITLRMACHQNPRPMPHQFAAFLDHPLRLRYRAPVETLTSFGVRPGGAILDLGCGTGLFTVELARMVGESGVVHAVDLQQPLLTRTQARVAEAGLDSTVHLHCCGAYQLPLLDDSIDLALLIATFSQIPNRLQALDEIKRVLKPEGRLAISEELLDPAYILPSITKQLLIEADFIFGGQTGSPFCYNMIWFNNK